MSFYNQDEEPVMTTSAVAVGDTVAMADVSSAGTIKSLTMQGVREFATRGITNCTASTLTVTAATHAGHTITLNRAGGIAVTLPAATGTGNKYRFVVGTTFTSSATIKAASASDTFCGNAFFISDDAAAVLGYIAGATADTVTLDGTTTGGYVGTVIEVTDIASTLFQVEVRGKATGTEATPFSATV